MMKKTLLFVAALLFCAAAAANLIPNGDLKDAKKRRIDIRLPDKGAKILFTPGSILVDSLKKGGLAEFNCHRLTGLAKGKRHYLRMSFEVLEFDSSFSNQFSARVIFFDKNGKVMTPNHLFTPKYQVTEVGKNDLFYSFIPPAAAEKCSLTFWLKGVKKARVKALYLSRKYPVNNPDGNLLLNGDLESSSMADFYFRWTSKKPLRILERSAAKSKSGRYAVRSFCSDPRKSTEINFNSLPFTPGKKYRFSADYFVASASGENKVTGRVTFWNKNKVIRYMFPAWSAATGQWKKMDLSFYPPTNCTCVTLTLWFYGKQEVFLDNFYYGFDEEKVLANRHAGALLISENPDCSIWKESPYLKVPYKGIPAGLKSGSAVEIAAAANESEPFQIIVNGKKSLPDVTLAFSPLKGKGGVIPAKAFSLRRVGFVDLKKPDNPSLKGFNADPLLPETSGSAEKGKNLPFFVRINVPAGTAAGNYEGSVRVLSGKKELGRFALKLRVFDFELPASPHMKSYFYTQGNPGYNVWDKRPTAVKNENFHKLLKEHRMTGNQALWLPAPKWKIENGKLIITDWSRFDQQAGHRIRVYGQRNLPVPILSMKGDNYGWFAKGNKRTDKPGRSPFGNFNLISPEGLKYAGQFAKAFCDHVKEKFPGTVFYAYLYDEPPAKVHADLKVFLDSLHKAAPDLKIFIPKLVNDQIGYVHTFAVPFAPGYYNAGLHEEHVKKGGDIWYYNWTVRLSNHDYILNRLFGWRIYAGQGSGGLLWCTNWTYKDVNPWTDFDRVGYSCGNATIFYPPRKAGEECVPSQRAAMIRESIDDFDYMRILERLIDKKYPGTGRTRVMEILKPLLPEPPFEYVNDPHLLYQVRQNLAENIESFKKFPAAVVSTPSDNSKVEISSVRIKVYAPQGTAVKINGKTAGKVGKKALEIPFTLSKLGINKVRIDLARGGKSCSMVRTYELAADPRLKELAALIGRGAKEKIDTRKAAEFLAQVNKGRPYTAKERQQADELVSKLKYALASKSLKTDRTFVNPLEKFFFDRAKEVFSWKLFERSEYYLALAAEAARAGSTDKFKVKVTPVLFRGHPALRLDNGIIQATILETGATLVSFKINGVETFVPGPMRNLLSPQKRAAQKVSKDMATRLGGYDGFTDAGGGGIWPAAFVDWNIAIRQLTSDRVSLSFSMRLPDTSFMFQRNVSLKSGSSDLVMDYEITNLMPADSASDDPEHLQLPWRGRFVPGIGSGRIPQTNDKLVVPVKYDRDKLEQSHFRLDKGTFFERRSVRLTKPFMGVYDSKLKKGVVFIGGPVTTHGYVWFNSKGNHTGDGKVYTLEFCRSFYGKKYDDAEPNSPLTIRPGKRLNFSLIIRGLSRVKDDADLVKQTGL